MGSEEMHRERMLATLSSLGLRRRRVIVLEEGSEELKSRAHVRDELLVRAVRLYLLELGEGKGSSVNARRLVNLVVDK